MQIQIVLYTILSLIAIHHSEAANSLPDEKLFEGSGLARHQISERLAAARERYVGLIQAINEAAPPGPVDRDARTALTALITERNTAITERDTARASAAGMEPAVLEEIKATGSMGVPVAGTKVGDDVQAVIRTLNMTYTDLGAALSAPPSALGGRVSALIADRDTAKAALATETSARLAAENTLATVRAELARLQPSVDDMTTLLTMQLGAAPTSPLEGLKSLIQLLEAKEAARLAAERAQAAAEVDRDTALAAKTLAESNLADLRTELAIKQTALDEANTAYAALELQLTTVQAQLTQAKEDLSTAQAELKTAQDALDAATEDAAAKTSALADATAARDQALTNLDAIKAELEDKKTALAAATAAKTKAEKDVTRLTDTVHDQQNELGNLRGTLAEQLRTIDSLQTKVVKLKNEIEELKDKDKGKRGK